MAESQGVEPCDDITTVYGLAIRCITILPALVIGGNGEIRTHGPLPVVGFQDRCNKPGSATFPYLVLTRRIERLSMVLQTTAMTTSAKSA